MTNNLKTSMDLYIKHKLLNVIRVDLNYYIDKQLEDLEGTIVQSPCQRIFPKLYFVLNIVLIIKGWPYFKNIIYIKHELLCGILIGINNYLSDQVEDLEYLAFYFL